MFLYNLIDLSSFFFQDEIYFIRPEVKDIAISTRVGRIKKIKILFKCDEGKLCDNVDAIIKGCVEGKH